MGTGSLAISNGSNSFSVTIDSTNNTLAGIRDAINASSTNTSVRANILTDTSGARLVLTSKETGASNTISIAVTDNDGNNTDAYNALSNTTPGLSQLSFTSGGNNLTQVQAAQNAQVKLDNVDLSFSSNTVVDAIPGVTLKLTKENVGTPATVTIARDSTGIKKVADDFVKAYNDLHSTIAKNTAANPSTTLSTSTDAASTASALTGDSTARSIDRQMREALRTVPSGVTGALTQLADAGISIDSSGVMSVDATKFQKAVDTNFSGLQSMMDGYGKAVNTLVTTLTDTNGVISARTTGLKDSIKLLDNQKEMLNNRLTSIEKRYRARFSSLDTMISGMQTTSTFLTQQIAKM
jgi:flagellar hook-associated protein 2